MPDWLQIAQVFGVPVAILLATGIGIWRILLWLAPRVDRVVERHLGFVDAVQTAVTEQAERFDKLDSNMRRVGEHIDKVTTQVQATTVNVDKVATSLAELRTNGTIRTA